MKATILFWVFMCIGFNLSSNPPSEIYYGKKGPWYIYLDLRKDIKVAEVGGIKYGSLDVLHNVGQNDTIAFSKVGFLLLKDGHYWYKNDDLNLKVKLKSVTYTEKRDYDRYKLFGVDAFRKISALEEEFVDIHYKMDSNEIYEDYIYFRNNTKISEDYQPSYLSRFYLEVEYLSEE